jgi:hypothetical protein
MMTGSEHHDQYPRQLTEAERAAVQAEHWSWLRYIAISACDGMALGALIAVTLIRLDVQHIGSMLARSSHELGYTALLIAGFAHTFGMVVSGTAIWLRATERRE